ncbi:unnamed protein product [Ectocarpus sp. 8 AP-2014]
MLGAGANGGASWRGCHGKTLLHAAAEGGNVQGITRLSRAGAGGDMKAKTLDSGHTPLDLAVAGGKRAAAKALIMAGADVNALDATNDGPLHHAIKGGHVGIAKDLLLSGANPMQAGSNGDFPIHLAAWHGLDEVVLALVQKGIDLNCVNNKGDTPLCMAVRENHVATMKAAASNKAGAIRALFEAGADIDGPRVGREEFHWNSQHSVARMQLCWLSCNWEPTPTRRPTEEQPRCTGRVFTAVTMRQTCC